MRALHDYLRLAVFFAAALAGLQIPAFINQYGDTLDAHFREVQVNLGAFQDDADRYFGGNLDALIQYYLNSEDEIFNEGGASITAIYQRHNALEAELNEFRSSWFNALKQVGITPRQEIRQETLANYDYQVPLNGISIACGIAIGLILSTLVDLTLFSCGFAWRCVRPRRKQPGANR